MRFALTDEQLALQEAARAFLRELPGPASMAEHGDRYDLAAWSRLVEEQGWTAINVPTEAGGWGFGLVELAVVFEELGRAQSPCPLFGSAALATSALRVNGDAEQQARWLAPIAAGALATAVLDPGVHAEPTADGCVLRGAAARLIDGDQAELFVVHTPQGWWVVPREDLAEPPGRLPSLDTTRPLSALRLDGVRCRDHQRLHGAALGPVLQRAAVLLAAEQVGGADFMLQTAVDYAGVRKQYGKPIGSFQAIQHLCADLLLQVESARSAVRYAAWAVEHGSDDAAQAVRTAKATASEAFFASAGQCIQVHGGIGFTWEHPCHLYFKRARAGLHLLGEPNAHREAVAAWLLDAREDPWEHA
jgi:alkylation response protein AidB-like acyl-CoA dehydrogenase